MIITAHNQAKAGQAGAIKPIVMAVSLHMANAEVCESGCGALWNMTVDGMRRRGGSMLVKFLRELADNQVKAGDAGAVEVVVKAMDTHINDVGACISCCGALWNISKNGKLWRTLKRIFFFLHFKNIMCV